MGIPSFIPSKKSFEKNLFICLFISYLLNPPINSHSDLCYLFLSILSRSDVIAKKFLLLPNFNSDIIYLEVCSLEFTQLFIKLYNLTLERRILMYISSINSQNTYQSYQQLASGKRINSAADDAAGLAIAEKLETQSNGYDVGKNNAATSQNMINVAEGALGSITDSLQRIRELSVQASNSAIYGDSELNAIQGEIEQLKQGISDVAKNTTFNTMNLLDGSMTGSNIATNPDGSGMKVDMPNATLEALGIKDFDVTGDFDISVIDKALEKVTSQRSELGATTNRLDSAMNFNSYASYNLTASKSNIEDLDMAKAVSEKEKNRILEQYKLMLMKKQISSADGYVKMLRF